MWNRVVCASFQENFGNIWCLPLVAPRCFFLRGPQHYAKVMGLGSG